MTARAETPEQKRAVIERIYAAWCACPTLRLGQLLTDATTNRATWHNSVFGIEDEHLAVCVEAFAKEHGTPPKAKRRRLPIIPPDPVRRGDG